MVSFCFINLVQGADGIRQLICRLDADVTRDPVFIDSKGFQCSYLTVPSQLIWKVPIYFFHVF